MAEFLIDVRIRGNQASGKLDATKRKLDVTERSANKLRRAMLGVFAGVSTLTLINGLRTLGDEFVTLQNRMRIVTKTSNELAAATTGIFRIANSARVPVRELSVLYQRASLAGDQLKASQQDVRDFVETAAKAISIQGGSIGQARGAIIQLSQAIGGATVRAEEFNSIQEGALPILQAAARGIDRAGGSVARLRNLVIEGRISSREFFEAIKNDLATVDGLFKRTIPTIAQALSVLQNKFIQYIGGSEDMKEATTAVARSIIALGDNLDGVVAALRPLFNVTSLIINNLHIIVGALILWAGIGIANIIGATVVALNTYAMKLNTAAIAALGGAEANKRFAVSIKTIELAFRSLGRIFLIGFIITAVSSLIEKYSELNNLVESTPVTWGVIATVAADRFANGLINGFVAVGKSIPVFIREWGNMIIAVFSAIGDLIPKLLFGGMTSDEAFAELSNAYVSGWKRIAEEIGRVIEGESGKRLISIASQEDLDLLKAYTTPTPNEKPSPPIDIEELSLIDQFLGGFIEKMKSMQENAASVGAAFKSMGEDIALIFGPEGTFSKGIGDAIADAIVFGKSFKDALRGIGQEIVKSVISNLVQIGVNMGINALIGKAIAAAATAAGVAQAATLATAYAPAAALASLASFGANAPPAIAGMTATAATSMGIAATAAIPFKDGGYVSGEGTGRSDSIPARLSNGEFVINAEATRRNRALLEAINSGQNVAPEGGTSTKNFNAPIFSLTMNGRNGDADEMDNRIRNIIADEQRTGGLLA